MKQNGTNTNATTIIAENCNVTPKLEICSINDENLECTNATGKNDKSISIESNNKPNIAKKSIAAAVRAGKVAHGKTEQTDQTEQTE